MKRYEKYKHSGVDWIGEIPEGWEVKKLKFLGNIYAGINGKKGDDFSKEYSEGIKSFIPFTNICNNVKIDEKHYQFVKIDENENQNRVLKNDILFLMSSETLDDIAKNSIYLGNDEELYLNSFCKGFRINDFNVFPEFINYLFLSTSYRNYFSLVGRGFTRINLKQEFINDALTLLPPLPEQTAIAAFLDDKTAKIDQTIAIRQKEIELLKERRQILIQKAVTKGLDDTVKLKPSGVDWIGEIPEHWEVRKLKQVCRINLESLDEKTNPNYEFEYIDIGSVTYENGIVNKESFLFKNSPSRARRIAKEGDTIVSTVRTYLKAIDFIDKSKSKYIFSTGFAVLKPNSVIYPKYLFSFIKSDAFTEQVSVNSKGMSYPAINSTELGVQKVLYLPYEEQTQIVSYLENMEAKISKAISIKEQEIEKLKEYKTVLIDSMVTGKVRVCCL